MQFDKSVSVQQGSKLTLGHVINPVIVSKSSVLFIAQPITFETMKRARDFVKEEIEVKLFSAQELS